MLVCYFINNWWKQGGLWGLWGLWCSVSSPAPSWRFVVARQWPVFPLRRTNRVICVGVPRFPPQTKVCDVMRVMNKFLWYDLTSIMKSGTARSLSVSCCLCLFVTAVLPRTKNGERWWGYWWWMLTMLCPVSDLTDLLSGGESRCFVIFAVCSPWVRMLVICYFLPGCSFLE